MVMTIIKKQKKIKFACRSIETIEDKQYPEDQKKVEGQVNQQSDLPSEGEELRPWSDLPVELLEKVFSTLNLIENIRASVTCKWWQTIGVSRRITNKPPWLMHFPKHGTIFEFYDPYSRRSYKSDLKELVEQRVCTAKYGWLLLYTDETVVLFNPFTREVISLPKLQTSYHIASFSSPPTDPSCMVLAIKHISSSAITISCCNVGDEEWSTCDYINEFPFVCSAWMKLVFTNGMFYCLSHTGSLGVFNPKERMWNVLGISPPTCPDNYFNESSWTGRFLSEYKGDLLLVFTRSTKDPVVYKFNRAATEWEIVHCLEDVTIFAGYLTSISRNDLPGTLRDRIYFSKVRFFGKQCISYSLGQQRFYPRKQSKDWGEEVQYDSVWVDPPNDLSTFIGGCSSIS